MGPSIARIRLGPEAAILPFQPLLSCPTACRSVASGSAAGHRAELPTIVPDGTAVDRVELPLANCTCSLPSSITSSTCSHSRRSLAGELSVARDRAARRAREVRAASPLSAYSEANRSAARQAQESDETVRRARLGSRRPHPAIRLASSPGNWNGIQPAIAEQVSTRRQVVGR